ncbi:MAG: DUF192 domain-containing protein [DPANN group archaeon]|nr:DUF192 domain-containing protein [DPANN group archaeon]
MKSSAGTFLILTLVLLLGMTIASCSNRPAGPAAVFHGEQDATIALEVVDTPETRQQGLMFREQLNKSTGMLFVWQDEQPRAFWMKNTLIPLDMVFIDRDWRIVDIFREVQPCEKDPCPIYRSLVPARYVIEMNAGFTEKHQIEKNDTVTYLPARK